MRVEVAVHSVLRNHGVAESTFIGAAAARRRRQLRPHVGPLAQPRAPERLDAAKRRRPYILFTLPTILTLTLLRHRLALKAEVSVALRKKKKEKKKHSPPSTSSKGKRLCPSV